MILVYFSGYGDWYVEGDEVNGLKANRHLEHRNLGRAINTSLFPDLNYIPSFKVEGVFGLSESDGQKAKYTGIFQNENINRLRASLCEGSAFTKLVREGICSEDIVDRCFFQIVRTLPSCCGISEKDGNLDYYLELVKQPRQEISDYKKEQLTALNHNITVLNEISSSSINHKREERLSNFIEWLEIQTKLHGICFDKYKLNCTKDHLFEHLKCWEKSRFSNERLFNVKGWTSCGRFWDSPARKNICNVDSENRKGRESRDSAYKNFDF